MHDSLSELALHWVTQLLEGREHATKKLFLKEVSKYYKCKMYCQKNAQHHGCIDSGCKNVIRQHAEDYISISEFSYKSTTPV